MNLGQYGTKGVLVSLSFLGGADSESIASTSVDFLIF